ncbi:MAG: hypothetical protein IJL06_05550 [Kiritimatiellae bacterium]|nr:hypothetical protein [Kiritimatiellia bacterium]
MPIDVSSYNAQFSQFVQFAEQAGKSTGQAVDEAALAKIVKGAKFDKATVASLRATAKAANDAMRALDGFSGADFATAMVRDKQTGVVGWKGYWAFGNEALLELPVIVAIKGHRKPLPPADAGRAMFGNLPAIRV